MSIKVIRITDISYIMSLTNEHCLDLEWLAEVTGLLTSTLLEGIVIDGIRTVKEDTERSQANVKAERAENREATG